MTEASLKTALTKRLRETLRGAVITRFEDRHQFGVPDLAVDWYLRTTWWEIKLANPDLRMRSQQHEMACRREGASHCRYIIFLRKGGIDRFLIIRPSKFAVTQGSHSGLETAAELTGVGFDLTAISDYIKGIHINAIFPTKQ